jgi:hypothetical protein
MSLTSSEYAGFLKVAFGRENEEYAKFHSEEKRRQLAKEGKALPNLSYPIEDESDLGPAIKLAQSGHGDVGAAKQLIKKRAKALGKDDMVPSSWGNGSEKADAADGDPDDDMVTCPVCGAKFDPDGPEDDNTLGSPVKLPGSAATGGYR